mmetsp:Transcript_11538/g.13971  ORF Transcript_11538/g.13971 Transcript_11538/m.13971 type:complete len:209 (+) Transcript_11538:359-985(+)
MVAPWFPGELEKYKPVVAVDIDEVICGFLPALIRYHNDTYGSSFVLTDFNSYRFCETWGGTNEEAVHKVHEFFETEYFLKEMSPINGALETLRSHKDNFTFVCVTSRQHCIAEETVDWVNRHFPEIFDDFHFGNHWTKDAPDPDLHHSSKQTKPDMCVKANAVALIDDSLSYAVQCSSQLAHMGFKVCLFGDYGWNQGVSTLATVDLN